MTALSLFFSQFGVHIMRAILFSLCFISTLSFGQPPVSWQSFSNSREAYNGAAIAPKMTGGTYISCESKLSGFDAHGRQEWSEPRWWCEDISVVGIDTYMVTGTTTASRATMSLIDGIGNEILSMEYDFFARSFGRAGIRLSNGGFLLAGYIYPADIGQFYDGYLIKIRSNGIYQWQENYGDSHADFFNAVKESSTGDYFAVGMYGADIGETPWIICVDSSGTVIWNRHDDSFDQGAYYDCVVDGADNVVAVGYELVDEIQQGLIAKHSAADGSIIWRAPEAEIAFTSVFGIDQTIDGGYVVAGSSSNKGLLMKLDSMGDTLWSIVCDEFPTCSFSGIRIDERENIWIVGQANIGEQHSPLYRQIAMKVCPEGSNSGSIQRLYSGNHLGAYRLVHETNELTELVLTGIGVGSNGWVSGEASEEWYVLENGDGNDGDSVIFRTTNPLTEGEIDTFWVSIGPDTQCDLSWTAGCKMGTTTIPSATTDGLQFRGENYGFSTEIRLFVSVEVEFGVDHYEIHKWHPYSGYYLLTTYSASNDSMAHEHVYSDLNGGGIRYKLVMEDLDGCRHSFNDMILVTDSNVVTDRIDFKLPQDLSLSSYPNPFNPTATIEFDLPVRADVKLSVFNIQGQQVAKLVNQTVNAGSHSIIFDGSDYPSGLYFARLQAGEHTQTHKLMLLK